MRGEAAPPAAAAGPMVAPRPSRGRIPSGRAGSAAVLGFVSPVAPRGTPEGPGRSGDALPWVQQEPRGTDFGQQGPVEACWLRSGKCLCDIKSTQGLAT